MMITMMRMRWWWWWKIEPSKSMNMEGRRRSDEEEEGIIRQGLLVSLIEHTSHNPIQLSEAAIAPHVLLAVGPRLHTHSFGAGFVSTLAGILPC